MTTPIIIKDFPCLLFSKLIILVKVTGKLGNNYILVVTHALQGKKVFFKKCHEMHVPISVADPGFPIGGVDLRCGCFLAKMCAKTEEFGPVGGACAGHAPLDLPMYF